MTLNAMEGTPGVSRRDRSTHARSYQPDETRAIAEPAPSFFSFLFSLSTFNRHA